MVTSMLSGFIPKEDKEKIEILITHIADNKDVILQFIDNFEEFVESMLAFNKVMKNYKKLNNPPVYLCTECSKTIGKNDISPQFDMCKKCFDKLQM